MYLLHIMLFTVINSCAYLAVLIVLFHLLVVSINIILYSLISEHSHHLKKAIIECTHSCGIVLVGCCNVKNIASHFTIVPQ